ncbi:24598_t:CDS:2, partial [Gigaspora margarita]
IESSIDDSNNIDLDSNNKLSDNELELVQILSFYPQTLKEQIYFLYVQIQLAVTLFRLGSLSTIWAISAQFGIAKSTVHLFMERRISKIQGFSLVIGAIDGSHIPFFEAPSRINKDVYFSRKHKYGIHLQGIVDYKGLFINYDIGWPASVHDAKVFQNSNIYKQSANFFEKEEYLLGDSAYSLVPFVITPFKAFGCLKAKFQFLKQMKVKDSPK